MRHPQSVSVLSLFLKLAVRSPGYLQAQNQPGIPIFPQPISAVQLTFPGQGGDLERTAR
jgi:hypothetical protein